MQTTPHPDDERLAALAEADPDATADAALSAHVASCDACGLVVDDLRGLRAALAGLPDPDIAIPRPLRLLPPVPPPAPTFADRLAGVVRGTFMPVVTAGAALALVGAVGTTNLLQGLAGSAAAPQAGTDAAPERDLSTELGAEAGGASATPAEVAVPAPPDSAEEPVASAPGEAAALGDASPSPTVDRSQPGSGGAGAQATPQPSFETFAAPTADAGAAVAEDPTRASGDTFGADAPAERSIWPMVLFAGLALIVAAVLGRWIFAPRAV
jgi:hypothetical protein